MKGLFEQAHPALKLISLIVLMLFFLVVTILIGAAIAVPFVGFDGVAHLLQDISYTEDSLPFLRYFQTLQGLGLFVVPACVAAYLFSQKPWRYLGADRGCQRTSLLWLLGGILLAIPLVNFIGVWNDGMQLPDSWAAVETWMRDKEEVAKGLTELFVSTESFAVLGLNLLMIAVIPALGEELIFRGIFQRVFTQWSKNLHVGVWVAAFVFSAMHMQFYGFVPRLLLGALLGYVYAYSGNIWYAVWVHFINNGFAVVLYFLAAKEVISDQLDTLGTSNVWTPLFTGFIGAAMFYSFFRAQKLPRALR